MGLALVRQTLLFAALLVPLEVLWPARAQRRLRLGVGTDLLYAGLTTVVCEHALLLSGMSLAAVRPAGCPARRHGRPPAGHPAALSFLAELGGYWTHRLSHPSPSVALPRRAPPRGSWTGCRTPAAPGGGPLARGRGTCPSPCWVSIHPPSCCSSSSRSPYGIRPQQRALLRTLGAMVRRTAIPPLASQPGRPGREPRQPASVDGPGLRYVAAAAGQRSTGRAGADPDRHHRAAPLALPPTRLHLRAVRRGSMAASISVSPRAHAPRAPPARPPPCRGRRPPRRAAASFSTSGLARVTPSCSPARSCLSG